MSLYKYLKETILLNELRDTMIPKLHRIQDLIFLYSKYENKDNLVELESLLDEVINQLDSLGYNYEPSYDPNESESVFINILLKYRDNISSFISNFNEDNFSSFNSLTRYIANLVDIHLENLNS